MGVNGLLHARMRLLLATLDHHVSPTATEHLPHAQGHGSYRHEGQWYVMNQKGAGEAGGTDPAKWIHILTNTRIIQEMTLSTAFDRQSGDVRVVCDENDLLSTDKATQIVSFVGSRGGIDDLSQLGSFGSRKERCPHGDAARVQQWLTNLCQRWQVMPRLAKSLQQGLAFSHDLFAGCHQWEVSGDGLVVNLISTGRLKSLMDLADRAREPFIHSCCDAHTLTISQGQNGADQLALTYVMGQTPTLSGEGHGLKCLIIVRQDKVSAQTGWPKAS